jgi:hypothetical protein
VDPRPTLTTTTPWSRRISDPGAASPMGSILTSNTWYSNSWTTGLANLKRMMESGEL